VKVWFSAAFEVGVVQHASGNVDVASETKVVGVAEEARAGANQFF
tara:strand:+ start:240 stop:374 length:135 start_codon:yes stop_codon:yes gene_type:complete